jgi:hypothetical protein
VHEPARDNALAIDFALSCHQFSRLELRKARCGAIDFFVQVAGGSHGDFSEI